MVAPPGSCSCSSSPNRNIVEFTALATVAVGGTPSSIAVMDATSDGNIDILTVHPNTQTVSVVGGDGIGGFGTAANRSVQFNSSSSTVIGDFNGDRQFDLATLASGVPSTVSVRLGNANGSLGTAINTSVSGAVSVLAHGDFNSDGRFDLAIALQPPSVGDSSLVTSLLGNSTGGFDITSSVAVKTIADAIVAGDFNKDGRLDLKASDFVMFGDGTGSFGAPVKTLGSAANVVADFNNDGNLDVAGIVDRNAGIIGVQLGNGLGGFSIPIEFTASQPVALATGDVDNDGRLDLLIANSANSVSVLRNTTTPDAGSVILNRTSRLGRWVDGSIEPTASMRVNLTNRTLIVSNAPDRRLDVSGFADVIGTVKNDGIQGNRQVNKLRGNDGKDTLTGFAGNDELAGNAGNDSLTGGAGNDRFVFDIGTAFNTGMGVDRITDFEKGDRIALSQLTFTNLAESLTSRTFASVKTTAQAKRSSALITFISSTGKLYYNQNGREAGFGAGGLFADLQDGISLKASDFVVV